MENRQIILNELPDAELRASHFKLRANPMPILAEGEILVQTLYLSVDAANRAWMQGKTYREPLSTGDVMPGFLVGRVVESRCREIPAGRLVEFMGEWADYSAVAGKAVEVVPDINPVSHRLSALGTAGKTAYFGLLDVGRAITGETVVVSAAAGSIGTLVGQIGKIKGCRVIGIAGGAEKCAWLVDELGFDGAVDYKSDNLYRGLKSHCPDGIDVYFDNVGGTILETVIYQMNVKGRVVCCGAISQYDNAQPSGPKNLPGMLVIKRIRMEGFIALDFLDHDTTASRELHDWINSGKLKVVEDIVVGLENAPSALVGLLKGRNRGKTIVRV